jgi:hypothetical protein
VPRRYASRFPHLLMLIVLCSGLILCGCGVASVASLQTLELAIDWGFPFTVYFLNVVIIKLCVRAWVVPFVPTNT